MSANDVIDEDMDYEFRSLSVGRKRLLAVLPIPSAILSVLGSSVIIYMALRSRKSKPWTPYNRLLIGMSSYDVISSMTLAIAPFLNPSDSSNKAFAVGNDASCSAIGFLNQIAYSGTFYNAMLSFYFLLTARFGMKNDRIAQRIEPSMHIFSIGFPTVCAVVGLVLGVYSEPEVAIGCWVNRYPKRCGYYPDGTGETCASTLIAWVFGGWVGLFTLFALITNNAIILFFVRRNMGPSKRLSGRSKRSATERNDSLQFDDDDRSKRRQLFRSSSKKSLTSISSSMASSFRTLQVRSGSAHREDDDTDTALRTSQKRRLKLVSSQAFLFVASYVLCNIITYVLKLLESQSATYVEEKELSYTHYPLVVLQAMLLPLQGLFNMLVYIRPKYIGSRTGFPKETRFWAFRRAILGTKIEPLNRIEFENIVGENQKILQATGAKRNVSSLTHGSINKEEQGDEATNEIGLVSPIRNWASCISRSSKSLDIIGEFSGEDDSAPIVLQSNVETTSQDDKVTQQLSSEMRGTPNSRMVLMDGSIVSSYSRETTA
eukprot:scaffold2429_cov106-Cylindrotheca_fusiformis.AAC.4